ncbi:ribosome-binding ATPase YchF [bacterium BMS3Abin15]|nr:ribosome-binding ATPase YchF [bacterium BMS3Abin15]HDH07417.1 redox-regulated ATPase YchF [Candidatus Moranbacteria bacterium]HDZ85536.1 redox-regulated ATPase YchF [Candidatus Moranbacteria bacterium]
MKIGIVGLPNVGKSTLFKALTNNPVDINNYPFCTIEPNVGVVKVPDERLEKLAKMSKSEKIIPTVIEFVDIAGLVKGAADGEGLGNKFLSHIREVDAIIQVVRVFENSKITHVHNKIDPLNDIEIINAELIIADLETVNKRIEKLQKEARGNDKPARNATPARNAVSTAGWHSVAGGEAAKKLEITEKIKKTLEEEKLANETELDMKDEIVDAAVNELSLLTMKPFLYAYNISDFDEKLPKGLENKSYIHPHTKNTTGSDNFKDKYTDYSTDNIVIKNKFGVGVKLDIKIEEEMGEMTEKEKKELNLETGLNKLILKSYELLSLITFLTTGEDETRAWTVKKDSTAPEAGMAIHNDFQEKFIRADIINWEKLLEAGSWAKAKELGWMRTEGKEYIVADGDVIEFKI